MLAHRAAKRFRELVRRCVERNQNVGAQRVKPFDARRVAARRDDAAGAEMPRNLDREPPGHAGRAVDQHVFSALEPRALRQRGPRRHARIANRRSRHVAHIVRHRYAVRALDDRCLRHRAIRRARKCEIHAAAVRQMTHAIHAWHERQRRAAAVVPARRLTPHQLAERGRVHVNQRLTVAGDGISEIVESRRRIEIMDDSSFHHLLLCWIAGRTPTVRNLIHASFCASTMILCRTKSAVTAAPDRRCDHPMMDTASATTVPSIAKNEDRHHEGSYR